MSGVEVELHDSKNHATKLDSHVNIIVIGMHCLLVNDSGITAHMNSYSKEVVSISEVPIKDGVYMTVRKHDRHISLL